MPKQKELLPADKDFLRRANANITVGNYDIAYKILSDLYNKYSDDDAVCRSFAFLIEKQPSYRDEVTRLDKNQYLKCLDKPPIRICDVFMIMPFRANHIRIYNVIKSVLENDFKLTVKKGDDFRDQGGKFMDWVEKAINESLLVIAECSKAPTSDNAVTTKEPNANVWFELGYAVGIKKPYIPITQDINDIPSDLRSEYIVIYDYNDAIDTKDKSKLSEELRLRVVNILKNR